LCERLGSKSPAGRLAGLLAAAMLPNVVSPAALLDLARMVAGDADGPGGRGVAGTLQRAAAGMLHGVAQAAPALMVAALPQLASALLGAAREGVDPDTPLELPSVTAAAAAATTKQRKNARGSKPIGTTSAKGAAGVEGAGSLPHVLIVDAAAAYVAVDALASAGKAYVALSGRGRQGSSLSAAAVVAPSVAAR
jgi:hypothetical protein